MEISPLAYGNQNISNKAAAFTAEPQQQASSSAKTDGQKADEFLKKFENMPPAAVGLTSGLFWFGIGIGIDRLVGAILNGVFGAVIGAMSFWRARKES